MPLVNVNIIIVAKGVTGLLIVFLVIGAILYWNPATKQGGEAVLSTTILVFLTLFAILAMKLLFDLVARTFREFRQ
jgi:hypothetical protein